jgi:hypothetical protein
MKRLEAAAMLLAAGILVYQLLLPPVVGLADEGDFVKILRPVGLKYQIPESPARYYDFLTLRYDIVPPWSEGGYVTSESLLAAIARLYAGGIPARGVLDIRVLGALHIVLFVAGLALLLAGSRGWSRATRFVFAGLLIFFFTDVGYAAYFNSFYSATASFLFLLLSAGAVLCLVRDGASRGATAVYWLAALGFATSKPQESLQAGLLAVLGVLLARRGREGRQLPAALLAASLCLAGAAYYFRTPLMLKTDALYNDVFLEILQHTNDPEADLSELGLPAEWAAYSGTHAYLPDSPIRDGKFRSEFLKRVGYRKIVGFYLRHPARLSMVLRAAAQRAFRLRQHYLGNFAKSEGGKPRERSRAFGLWSGLKTRLGPSGPWLLPLLWLGNFAGAVVAWRASRSAEVRCLASGVAVLVAMSVLEFLVCSLGDALADVARHLHSFNAMTDLLLIADVTFLVSRIAAPASEPRAGTSPAAPATTSSCTA